MEGTGDNTAADGEVDGAMEGTSDNNAADGDVDGAIDSTSDNNAADGYVDGAMEGTSDNNVADGYVDGAMEDAGDNAPDGDGDGAMENTGDNKAADGDGDGAMEGTGDNKAVDGEGDGVMEGTGDNNAADGDGDGAMEGTGDNNAADGDGEDEESDDGSVNTHNTQSSSTSTNSTSSTSSSNSQSTTDGLSDNERYERSLSEQRLTVLPCRGDGNCFFRAVSLFMDGTERNHFQYRLDAVEYITERPEEFHGFANLPDGQRDDYDTIEDRFQAMLTTESFRGQDAGDVTMTALARLLDVQINLWRYSSVEQRAVIFTTINPNGLSGVIDLDNFYNEVTNGRGHYNLVVYDDEQEASEYDGTLTSQQLFNLFFVSIPQ